MSYQQESCAQRPEWQPCQRVNGIQNRAASKLEGTGASEPAPFIKRTGELRTLSARLDQSIDFAPCTTDLDSEVPETEVKKVHSSDAARQGFVVRCIVRSWREEEPATRRGDGK